ncbi:lysophospholipid acyltransferase family protein [Planococcus sp. ISL-109]|uniref:lysophospholipid acyltransferase family protein n=1 Tax=Planococcus sp. ISL-109 TaxID=2819166 RepID=UPI001BEC6AC7|nr:lysophospholipid acyltransferase family protein [Planococcus sp. ISL-109]MBT2582748.1 lysophospholipid acyltransferase family protein [Planococcus sp. ISL-109]
MIRAKKSALLERAFAVYLLPSIHKSFSHLYGRGIRAPKGPALIISNHSSWWDGLLFFFLNHRVWKLDVHIMMHERGLRQFPFFRRLGAFSIDRSNPKDILASLRYAEQLLKEGKTVILFPQGDEFHLETRPLQFHTGILYLMEKCPQVPLVPVRFYYSMRREKNPEVWIDQGEALSLIDIPEGSRHERTLWLQDRETAALDRLKQEVLEENYEEFLKLLKRGRKS